MFFCSGVKAAKCLPKLKEPDRVAGVFPRPYDLVINLVFEWSGLWYAICSILSRKLCAVPNNHSWKTSRMGFGSASGRSVSHQLQVSQPVSLSCSRTGLEVEIPARVKQEWKLLLLPLVLPVRCWVSPLPSPHWGMVSVTTKASCLHFGQSLNWYWHI